MYKIKTFLFKSAVVTYFIKCRLDFLWLANNMPSMQEVKSSNLGIFKINRLNYEKTLTFFKLGVLNMYLTSDVVYKDTVKLD